MSTVPPNPQTPGGSPFPAPAPQKSSGAKVLFWILGIIVGLMLIGFGSCALIGFYAMHKVKQAGLDSDLMKKNPAYATAKMAVAMSPDGEIVSSDDNAGTIVVRSKKTGKTMTMKFDPEKKSMVIIDENGKTTTMTTTGEGANGGMEMKSSEGTVKIGASSDKVPDWVPVYPGSSPQSTFSVSNSGEQTGSYTFTTADSAYKMMSFYEDALKPGGFTVSNMSGSWNMSDIANAKAGGRVYEDKTNKRVVVVSFESKADGTHVDVHFVVKQ